MTLPTHGRGSGAHFANALLVCAGVWAWAALGPQPSAVAQGSVIGNWRAGETAIDVTVESWGGDCGPRPASMHSKGGGVVTIEQREQALLLHGRDQDIRTDACWSRNPAMRRSIASYSNGQWLTRCKTADTDPRAEQGTYTLKLTDETTLQYRDVSRYDWTLNESKCIATFTTSQTLTRSASADNANAAAAKGGKSNTPQRAPSETASSPAANSGAQSGSSCTPGAASKLTLRPKHADVELGEKVCFRARVTDNADCPLASQDVVWLLAHGSGVRGNLLSGCFTAAETAAEGEGEFRITSKRGNLQAEATVTVRRVDLSSLIAKRMEGSELDRLEADDDNEAVAITTNSATRIATKVEPEPTALPAESAQQRPLILGFGVVAIALMGLGFWVRRRQPLAAVSDGPPQPTPAAATSGLDGTTDPTKTGETAGAPKAAAKRPDEPRICPTCHVGYPSSQTTCPKDGSALVPYSEFTERSKRDEQARGAKRCPTCGKTYPASAAFCGEDGTSLVSVQ